MKGQNYKSIRHKPPVIQDSSRDELRPMSTDGADRANTVATPTPQLPMSTRQANRSMRNGFADDERFRKRFEASYTCADPKA